MKKQLLSEHQKYRGVEKQSFIQATSTNRSFHDSKQSSTKRKQLMNSPTPKTNLCLVAKSPKLLSAYNNKNTSSQFTQQNKQMIEVSEKPLAFLDRIAQLCTCLKIQNDQKPSKLKSFQSQRRNLLTLLSGAPIKTQKTITPINSLLNLIEK